MAVDVNSFLDALAAFMVERAAAQTPPVTIAVAKDLWLHEADEASVPAGADGRTKPYSVLVAYNVALPYVPVPVVSVQCRTVGFGNQATFARAVALFNTLLDAEGKPLRMTPVPAASPSYRLNGVDLRGPSLIGRDGKGRPEVVFNVDAKIVKL